MAGKLSEYRRGIRLKLQDVATNDGVEASTKCHPGGIALEEQDVSTRVRIRSRARNRQGTGCAVDSDDFARVTDQLRQQKRDVSSAAPDVEHPHPVGNPRLAKVLSRDWVAQ